jgi:hypothetical protein
MSSHIISLAISLLICIIRKFIPRRTVDEGGYFIVLDCEFVVFRMLRLFLLVCLTHLSGTLLIDRCHIE